MNTYPKFIYLSQLLGAPVISKTHKQPIGYLSDITAEIKDMYPRVTGIVIRLKGKMQTRYITWGSVTLGKGDLMRIIIRDDALSGHEKPVVANEILLKDTFLDKQIVDISGSKVVRVNDLHILRDDRRLWLVHVDVGFTGILRRLGWLPAFNVVTRWLFGFVMQDKIISWKYVQPVPTDEMQSLALTVSQKKLSLLHPADLADIIIDLGTEERINIFSSLDIKTAADTMQELPLKIAVQIASMLPHDELIDLLNAMPVDELVDLLSEMEHEAVQVLFKDLPPETVQEIKDLMKHSERSAGSLMTTEFISVKPTLSVAEVLKKIKHEAREAELIYYIYVVDGDEKLLGVVTLKHLILAEPGASVESLIHRKLVSVEVDTHVKKVAQVFFKYNFVVVPVVDEDNHMEGIITIKDALEAVVPEIREETEENT